MGFGVVEQSHGDRVAGGMRDAGHGVASCIATERPGRSSRLGATHVSPAMYAAQTDLDATENRMLALPDNLNARLRDLLEMGGRWR